MLQKQKQILSTVRKKNCQGKNRILSFLNCGIALSILTASFAYVLSANDLSIKGFVIERMKSEIKVLENENKLAELKIMERESYEYIDQRARQMSMVKIDKIDYIKSAGSDVARR